MVKKTAMAGLILLVVGLVGSIFTFRSVNQAKDIAVKKEINDNFKEIAITTDNANVKVLPTSGSRAMAELTGKGPNHRLSVDVEESVLKVDVSNKQKKLYNFDFSELLVTLKVYVPEEDYDSLQIESDNGQVQINELLAKDIHVETDNGIIKLNDIEGETIAAAANNGIIDLKSIAARDVALETDNGKILLDGVEGKLFSRASNGGISLLTQDLDRPIDFATDNGKITIQTEKEPTNAILDVQVDNGKVDIFGKNNWDTVIGEGEHLIKLTTANGNIVVKK